MDLFSYKANVKRFGFNNLHQDLDTMKIVKTVMDARRDNRSKENGYKKYNIFKYHSTYQTRTWYFQIKNAKCTFLFLFLLYTFVCSSYLDKHPSLCE